MDGDGLANAMIDRTESGGGFVLLAGRWEAKRLRGGKTKANQDVILN